MFFLPAAAHTEKDGTFTNTQRLLQWHHAAVEPGGEARSELWFTYHLGRRIREKLAGSEDPMDRPVLDLTWDYPTRGRIEEPDAEAVLAEINGWDEQGTPLSSYTELADDGSTACGCWIYCGAYADGVNRPARRVPGGEQSWVAPEWGWAWPANRRILYNRASADPDGNPWSERKAYVWWDPAQGRWTGHDVPDFEADKAPDHAAPPDATGPAALGGRDPFIMQADGKAWLFAPAGLTDGPLPTHYEPQESPVANALYDRARNPARQMIGPTGGNNLFHPSDAGAAADVFPFVATTYRLTEHHTAGGMSRWQPYLSELQPEMFCEVSPSWPPNAGSSTSGGPRSSPPAARSRPGSWSPIGSRACRFAAGGSTRWACPTTGGRTASPPVTRPTSSRDLSLDPNVHIQEVKAFTCDMRAGRRPRGRRATPSSPSTATGPASPTPRDGRPWRPARARPTRVAASSPTRASASAARRARSRARSGTGSRRTG